jgi:aminoglycoside 2'-N-acetyltransferase I
MPATVQRSPTPPEGVEAMVRLAFGEGEDALRPEDWGHALGGVHLTAWLDGAPVGHAAVVARRLWCGERELRAGYVEAVATHPGHRRRGIGHALMAAAEAEVAAFELGALAPSDDGQTKIQPSSSGVRSTVPSSRRTAVGPPHGVQPRAR